MGEDLIAHNPLLKKPILTVLSLAETTSDRVQLEEAALAVWEDSYTQSVGAVIDILVRNGALIERAFVDGEPYDGTLADMQFDENVADDAVAEVRLALTPAGSELAAAYQPAHTLAALFADRPAYAEIFASILKECAKDEGATREDLEKLVESAPKTDGPKVYPQYFIDALETAGGIAWDGVWRVTEAGREVSAA